MLEILQHGAVRELKLARKPANALNPELVGRLIAELSDAPRHADAVVVSGLPGMFCAGLDLPGLMNFSREEISRFWQTFLELVRTIAFMPVPTVFAMTGHAPAGGIVMALFGDYRIMPGGNYKTGLNEVQVGLVIPSVMHQALARTVGHARAEKLLVSGQMIGSERALELGLIDEVAGEPEDVVKRGIQWCEQQLALPRNAMLTTRRMTRSDLHALFEDISGWGIERFVEIWFSDETQETLRAVVDRLTKK